MTLLYWIMGIIRDELNSVKEDWHTHFISRSYKSGPTGHPSCMYYLPHLYDKQDCVQRINKEEIEEFDSVIGELPSNFTPEFSAFKNGWQVNLSEPTKLCIFGTRFLSVA